MGILNKNRFISPTRALPGKTEGLSIIILSSSPGYRMRQFGPKCLIKDKHSVSILHHQTAMFQMEFPHCEIIVVGGFECDKIVKNKPEVVRIVENQRFEELNEVEDLRLGINNCLYEKLLVVFGDIYFLPQTIKDIAQKESVLVTDSNKKMLEDDIGTTVVDNYITITSLAIENPKWAKIAYFAEKEFKLLKQFVSNRDNNKLFMFEAINYILDKKGSFKNKSVGLGDFLVHIDSTKELEKIL